VDRETKGTKKGYEKKPAKTEGKQERAKTKEGRQAEFTHKRQRRRKERQQNERKRRKGREGKWISPPSHAAFSLSFFTPRIVLSSFLSILSELSEVTHSQKRDEGRKKARRTFKNTHRIPLKCDGGRNKGLQTHV